MLEEKNARSCPERFRDGNSAIREEPAEPIGKLSAPEFGALKRLGESDEDPTVFEGHVLQ